MAHKNYAIQFRFLKLPVTWDSVTLKTGEIVFRGQMKEELSPDTTALPELDGEACRDRFFSLPENDPAQIRDFLNAVGVWSKDEESASLDALRRPLYVHLDEVWTFRNHLRDSLLPENREKFKTEVTPELPKPKTLLGLMTEPYSWVNEFPLRFELSKIAAGVVTLTNARRMLFATVLADVASGIRFKECKRRDCRKPFAIESKHKKKFCSQYCGHLVSQRKKRHAEQNKKRADRRRARK
jgi:hypothetical protein